MASSNSVSQPRHTFQYLDSFLSSEKVDSFDNFFLELDVATYMVEGETKQLLARMAYHTLRGVAIAVQMVVFAVITVVKYVAQFLCYMGELCCKAACVLFVTMPLAVQRVLFPTAADRLEVRVEEAQEALEEGTFSEKDIIGLEDNKFSYSEQKQLMQALLIEPLRALPERSQEIAELCTLMNQIADGDLQPDVMQEKEERVKSLFEVDPKELSQEELTDKETRVKAIVDSYRSVPGEYSEEKLKEIEKRARALIFKRPEPVPHFSLLVNTFISAFKNEKAFEAGITAEDLQKDPTLFLQYPHLLLRKDFEEILATAPEDLQEQLTTKKASLMQKGIRQAHQKEKNIFSAIAALVKPIDLKETEEKYLSTKEENFLMARCELLEQRIQQLENQGKQNGFEYHFMKFELSHLKKQQVAANAAMTNFELLEANQKAIEEINALHASSKKSFENALEQRFERALDNAALELCKGDRQILNLKATIQLGLDNLEEEEEEDHLKALHDMLPLLHELEMRMFAKGLGNDSDIQRVQESVIEYNEMFDKLAMAHESDEWKAFAALTTPQHRNETRLNGLANDVLSMLLETRTECQVPLLLALQDTRSLADARFNPKKSASPAKGSFKEIEDLSVQFVKAVREKYLDEVKKRLVSVTEFVAQVQEEEDFGIFQANDKLKDYEKKELLNFKQIGLSLDISEDLSAWYSKLQQLWVKHMPVEQEELLQSISFSKNRKAKMAECFEQWLEMTTGKKLGIRLSFDHITLPDSQAERKAALKKIKTEFKKEPALLKRVREEIEQAKEAGKNQKAGLQGFSPELIVSETGEQKLARVEEVSDYVDIDAAAPQTFEDLISSLERLKATLPNPTSPKDLDWLRQWVVLLDEYAKTTECQSLTLMILKICQDIIRGHYKDGVAVPEQVQEIYLNLFKETTGGISKYRFETMHNAERGEFLAHFLMLHLAEGNPIELTEEEATRLRQVCSLSFLTEKRVKEILDLVTIVGVPTRSEFSVALTQLSVNLQASPIGLEGIDAEIVRESFKTSTLPTNSQTRSLLDALMGRGTNELSYHLLTNVYDHYMKEQNHHQAREAIARALIHAHTIHPKQTVKHLLACIDAEKANLAWDNNTMAPPLYIFYSDLLRQVDPKAYFDNQDIQNTVTKFHTDLGAVKEANALLMDFARIIVELSHTIRYKHKNGEHYEVLVQQLMQHKVAYQGLKKNYFEGKIEIKGFLKIACDLAEAEMIRVDDIQQAFLDNPACEAAIKKTIKKWMLSANTLMEQTVKRELGNIRGEPQFKPSKIKGYFTLGQGVVMDTLTGIVYNDGQQKIHLSPHLQNHPYTHVLGIHNFSYVWAPDLQAFIYFVKQENGESLPHLLVKNIDQKPAIYKKLRTSFDDDSSSYLQFVPKETVQLPISIVNRMGIQHFWKDNNQKLYGYNNDGELTVIFKDNVVTTATENYVLLNAAKLADAPNDPILSLLLKNFDANELLMNQDSSVYFVPALGLKLAQKADVAGNEAWVCELRGISDKILDVTNTDQGLLTIKNAVDQKKLARIERDLKEANYRRGLANVESASLKDKNKIAQFEKAILQQKNKKLGLEEPLYVGTCPDEAYQEDDVNEIVEMLPEENGLRAGFLENLKDALGKETFLPYEVLPHALIALSNVIDGINLVDGDQKEVAPLLEAYLAIQKRYAQVCDKFKEAVFFDKAVDDSAVTKDLTGALTIVVNQLVGEEPDCLFLIKQLAKYPCHTALSSAQTSLLERALKKINEYEHKDYEEDMNIFYLKAYLQFMRYHHFQFKVRELATTPLSDKQAEVQAIQKNFDYSNQICHETIDELDIMINQQEEDDEEIILPQELRNLWRKVGIDLNHDLVKVPTPVRSKIETSVSQPTAIEYRVYGSKNFLERFNYTHLIDARAKAPENVLSEHQKELSNTFSPNSYPQVSGFYFEKLGLFSMVELHAEFKVDEKGKAMYGLRKEDVEDIFNFLREEKCITFAKGMPNLHCLTSADVAGKAFPANKLRARLAHLPLTQKGLQMTLDRVQAFLFRAMQSGFDFSYVEGAEETISKRLEKEKKLHLQNYLEAESIVKQNLQKYHTSMVELKYAYLTGDYSLFLSPDGENEQEVADLANQLTRYLFHKSEVQHIENIQKAPNKGERNKIELLLTRRNYNVDLLLNHNLQGEQKREQIMQRAYLVFEEDYGNRCNLMQIRMFRALMLGNRVHEGIDAIQARMGFGKTALLPMLAIVRVAIERTKPETKRHLVRYIVPRAVLEDNTSSFNQRFSAALNRNVLQDRDFNRYQIDADDPKASFNLILADLKARLHFYEETKRHGNMIIQPPEVRCSMEAQDLDFGQMLSTKALDPELRDLCLEAKRLLVKIRSLATYNVFDELDDTQDYRSREVNFTRGSKIPIPTTQIRPIERLVTYIEQNKNKDWTDRRERADEMVKALCTNRKGEEIEECPDELLDYLCDPNQVINDVTKKFLSKKLKNSLKDPSAETENDAMLFLIRMVLLDEYILSLVRSKQPNTHYGVRFSIVPMTGEKRYSFDPDSHSALLISVPYEGVTTPKGLSVFDNREVAAITTFRYYMSNETSFDIWPHVDFLITQIKQDEFPEELAKHYLQGDGVNEHPAIDSLRKMAKMLDADELKKAKQDFHQQYMSAPTKDFRKFFAMMVMATQIRSDEACAKSDRYEQGSTEDISLGCSGTVGDTSSYFTRQAPDPAADGMLSLEIMGRDNNKTIEWLTSPQPNEDYLPAIIRTLLQHIKRETRAIADIAGICKSKDGTPETVIKELWNQLIALPDFADVEGIIYYGKDNVKRLYRGEAVEPVLCNTEMELTALAEGRKYFSFYKQKNCRGSDIKQAHGAHFIVTMDENVSNSDGKQTILRFRNIVTRDSGQTFSFAAMPEYKDIVIDGLKAEQTRLLNQCEEELKEVKTLITDVTKALKLDKKNQELKATLRVYKEKQIALEAKEEIITKRLEKIPNIQLQAKHIAHYLRLEEKNAEEDNALTIFRKEMRAHIKVAATHLESELLSKLPKELTDQQKLDFEEFLQRRGKISPFVEQSLNSLYEKYGTETKVMERDAFVDEQKKVSYDALKALFKVARDFADKQGIMIGLEEKIYKTRMDYSIEAFKKRFGKDKLVQISGTQSDGQNVAQAQAQAEALAEAEACTETITQTLLETQNRLWSPVVVMSKNPQEKPKFDFLEDDNLLAGIDDFFALEHSIRPTSRKNYYVSPLLQNKNEISHFVLVHAQGATKYIFISHEEAEGFKKEKEALFKAGKLGGSPFNDYTLHDLRKPKKSVDLSPKRKEMPKDKFTAQLPCVALGDNGVPEEYIDMDTIALRDFKLTNVTSVQLLPKLTVTETANLKGFVAPAAFGVSKEFNCTIDFNTVPTPNKLTMKVAMPIGGGAAAVNVEIPKNNNELNTVLKEVYLDNTVAHKIEETHRRILDKVKQLFPQMEELEKKKKALEEIVKKNQDLIAGVSEFNFTQKMIGGLQSRDIQFASGTTQEEQIQKTVGADAIAMCEKIYKLQQEVKTNLTMHTLDELQQKFDEFVSPAVLAKAQNMNFNYKNEALFTHAEWTQKWQNPALFAKVPILERVYGRIVFSVQHGAKHNDYQQVIDACACAREDCNQMFATTIPSLLDVVPKLKHAVAEIKKNEIERLKIEKEIAELLKKAGPWMEALETAEKLKKQEIIIEDVLKQYGYVFDTATFFNQFHFESLATAPAITATQTYHGEMPEYLFTVQKDMVNYEKIFKGLTPEETMQRTKNRNFLNHVLGEAMKVEVRDKEVTFT